MICLKYLLFKTCWFSSSQTDHQGVPFPQCFPSLVLVHVCWFRRCFSERAARLAEAMVWRFPIIWAQFDGLENKPHFFGVFFSTLKWTFFNIFSGSVDTRTCVYQYIDISMYSYWVILIYWYIIFWYISIYIHSN